MDSVKNILIVDDEQDIAELIAYNLQQEGFQTHLAFDGVEAIKMANQILPHVILLDVNMPKLNGYQTCIKLRQDKAFKKTAILFLTAKVDEESEIHGLEIGADDFLGKPIKMNILISRIKNAIKKMQPILEENDGLLSYNNLILDRKAYTVKIDGEYTELAKKEFEVLYLLAKNFGKVLDRSEILNSIWGADVIVGDRTIDVHIRKIRQKLKERYIYTVKGVGYKFLDT